MTGIEWVADRRRLDAIGEAWDELARCHPTPFARRAWLWPWLDAYGDDLELATCLLWRGDELAAAFPALRGDRGLHAMANVETPIFAVPVRDARAREDLLAEVARSHHRDLQVLSLAADDPVLPALERQCAAAGRGVRQRCNRVSPIVETSGDLEAWRRATKPRWRVQLDRLRRKAEREHDLSLALVERPDDLEGTLRRGLTVEASGWKGAAGSAIAATPSATTLYIEAARRFHREDDLRLSWLEIDGRMVAFDLSILHGNRLWLLKTGFDHEVRRMAPGLMLHLWVIERCFELGLDALELLGDDDEWKRKFSTTERAQRNLHAFPPHSLTAAGYAVRDRARPVARQLGQLVGQRGGS
jgi:CelD/BcsL family acetyltransferase involved in cellulose biosynthesis